MPCQSRNHTPLGLIPMDLDASDTSQEAVVYAFMIPSILARSLSLGWFSQSTIGVKLAGSTLQPQPLPCPPFMLSANQLAPMSDPTHKTREITKNDLSSLSDESKLAAPISRSTHVKAPPVHQSSVQKAKSKALKPAQDPERAPTFLEVGHLKQKTVAPSPNLQIQTTKRVQHTAECCHKDLPVVPAGQYADTNVQCHVIIAHLQNQLSLVELQVLDFDLAVASFLQETNHLNLGDIPISVN
ncbi:hypothetical protein CROQUDRAFT_130749 [Cronartium quercuum f. sp. fusiforme G11]|uniref:Uncharacterized protein n=1 Tax=Cronartium quercuum f. sp. fusiforme G11 TaxID=708437 RepID=A0A9P6TF13_9BASI|nr:hypothetical protein CROQUDRAFT_130749 [Cronartium quercuum f. sp. fusiforme G11]